MDNNELRNKTMSGMFWKFSERFGAQLISFIVSIVLARLLMPEEYGIIALVTVIITLCDVFVNSGMGTALIQSKKADDTDFSTVFFFSFVLAVLIYIILFFAAPFLANYYNQDILCPVIRVMGIRIVIASFNTVQHAYVSRTMQFKKFFFSTLGGTIGSAVVGIWMAYAGFGVWALVGQYLFNSTVDTLVLFFTVKWRPKLLFSWTRWKQLFSYSWKILVSSLINTLYNNLRNLIIGKKYTSEDLAYYNKGKQFPDLVSDNILSTIENVLFPAISKKQDDLETVKAMVRRFIKTSTYCIMPMMIGLAAVADTLIRILLTEKWMFCVPYLRIYCFVSFLQPIQTANQQTIKALGRSDITLKLEIIKKVFGVALLLCVMKYGVFAIAASNVVYSCVVLIINSFPNIKLLKYSLPEQLKDIFENFIISVLMGAAVFAVGRIPVASILVLCLQVFVGVLSYWLLSIISRNKSYLYLKTILSPYVKGRLLKKS